MDSLRYEGDVLLSLVVLVGNTEALETLLLCIDGLPDQRILLLDPGHNTA